MNIKSNGSLTIRTGIFDELIPVEMHEEMRNICIGKILSGFGKIDECNLLINIHMEMYGIF